MVAVGCRQDRFLITFFSGLQITWCCTKNLRFRTRPLLALTKNLSCYNPVGKLINNPKKMRVTCWSKRPVVLLICRLSFCAKGPLCAGWYSGEIRSAYC